MATKSKSTSVPKLRFPEFRQSSAWRLLALGDVSEFVSDKILVFSIGKENYVSTENLLADFEGVSKASKLPAVGSVTRYQVGDVLISNIRPYLKKVWHADRGGGASNDVIVARTKGAMSSAFLASILKADSFIAHVMLGAKGVKMPRGDADSMRHYPVGLPGPAEQQKIADCLTSLDDVIAAQRRKVEALKTYKRGLMQQLFPRDGETVPRLRFPEFRDAPGWEQKEVGEVFNVTRGEVLAMPLVHEQRTELARYPVYSSQTRNGGLAGYYTEFLYEDAITWTTDGANAGEVNFRPGKFYCTNVCGVLLSSQGYANPCTAALIGSVSRNHVSYVGNPKLMNGVMARISIPIPSLAEQQRISNCLISLDVRTNAEGAVLDALRTHKKGLMQQLFPSAAEAEA